MVLEKEGPNDGLVSLKSAQWVSLFSRQGGSHVLIYNGAGNVPRHVGRRKPSRSSRMGQHCAIQVG